jgi:hypothetical protein
MCHGVESLPSVDHLGSQCCRKLGAIIIGQCACYCWGLSIFVSLHGTCSVQIYSEVQCHCTHTDAHTHARTQIYIYICILCHARIRYSSEHRSDNIMQRWLNASLLCMCAISCTILGYPSLRSGHRNLRFNIRIRD